ncbi:MAG: hypothetical protein KatS3mg114_1250 [Planctomycetaceae bacterium]|nr:MAG: hypothetical protein KatS3mg114_1250 [Planctomycetaceae bacterium]
MPELKKLGKYRIDRKLGAGGMGAVYLAYDTELRRPVALKVLPHEKAQNPTLVKRFRAEAQAAAQLRHENIVAVYDHGEVEGYLYIAMEYVEGTDLHALVQKRGPLDVPRSIEYIKQAAAALQHAWEHKIVHRDIKPSNLLVRRDGVLKLTDLGLARSVDESLETNITRAGTTVGTVDYMSPEQARNSKAADIRSDIYSLGCTWYHLLTGRPPFAEGSMTNKLHAHATQPPPDPRRFNPAISDGLVAVLNRMMAKRPEDRYQTPEELLDELEHAYLTAQAVSQEILSVLEDELPTETASVGGVSTKPAEKTLPPPPRRQPSVSDRGTSLTFSGEWLKRLGIAVGVAGVLGLMAWLASRWGAVVEAPAVTFEPRDPFSTAPTEVVVSPPAGTSSGSGQVADYTTPLAPVHAGVQPTVQPAEISSSSVSHSPPETRVGSAHTAGATPMVVGGNVPAVGTPAVVPSGKGPSVNLASANSPPFTWMNAATRGQQRQLAEKRLSIITIGPGIPSATHHLTLESALSHLPEAGGIIRFTAGGIYDLQGVWELRQPHIWWEAPPGKTVVVRLLSHPQRPAQLRLVGGELHLVQVHLLSEGDYPTDHAVLSVHDGTLTMTEGSLTLRQQGQGAVVAFRLSADQRLVRLGLAGCVCRLNRGPLFEVTAPQLELSAERSLLVSATGPLMRSRSAVTHVAEGSALRPTRIGWLQRCTGLTGGDGIEVEPAGDRSTIPWHLSLHRTVIASLGDQSRWVTAPGWSRPRLRQLRVAGQDSRLLGFTHWVENGQEFLRSAEDWREVWMNLNVLEPESFIDYRWELPGPVEEVLPAAVDTQTLPTSVWEGNPEARPGAPTNELQLPEVIASVWKVWRSRPVLPTEAASPPTQPPVLQVDLNREDLGQILSRPDLPQNAVIQAQGYGLCTMTPARVQQRMVHIVFRQVADKAPLRLTSHERYRDSEGSALFQVVDGGLALHGLRWQAPEVRVNQPSWLIEAVNSRILLRGCECVGPDRSLPGFKGVIRWQHAVGRSEWLALQCCWLYSTGRLLSLEGTGGQVFVQGCGLVSRQEVLHREPAAGSQPLRIDWSHNTSVAAEALISLAPAVEAGGTEIYAWSNVWSGWKVEPSSAPIFCRLAPQLDPGQALVWHGWQNAWTQLAGMVSPQNGAVSLRDDEPAAWRAGEQRGLWEPRDVMFTASSWPTQREGWGWALLSLHPGCVAATWNEGSPVGIDPQLQSALGPEPLTILEASTKSTVKKKVLPRVVPKTGGF